MRIAIIACEALKEEIESIVAGDADFVQREYLDFGLHLYPDELKHEILVRLNHEGYAILLAEQNAWKALHVAHRGYVLETGTVALAGTAAELLRDPGVQAAYLGA